MKRSCLLIVAIAIASGVYAQSGPNYNFDFHVLTTAKPLNMMSVNDGGTVVGFYHETSGAEEGFVYNPVGGFQDLALTNLDFTISKYTTGGNVYSRNKNAGVLDETSGIYRTSVGGVKTQLDLTNGGALTLGPFIQNTIASDDDRISFLSGGKQYVWSASTGTKLITGTVVSFGQSGSMFVNTGSGIDRVASDGTHSAITPPSGTSQYGQLVGYKELASGTKQYSFSSVGGQTEMVVPNGPYATNIFQRKTTGSGSFTSYTGQVVMAINDNGLAITGNNGPGVPYRLDNPLAYDVTDLSLAHTFNNSFIDAIDASNGFIIGKGTWIPSNGFNTVYGTYSGYAVTVPEPATFAVLGLGALVLCRRKKRS